MASGRCARAASRASKPEWAVRTSWPAWRKTTWSERAAVLFRAAAIMRLRRDELAALEVFEAGKPIAEADADVCEAIDFCEYYGRQALRLGAGAVVQSPPGECNAYRYQPRGVGCTFASIGHGPRSRCHQTTCPLLASTTRFTPASRAASRTW